MNDVTPASRTCEVCGGSIHQDNRLGVCAKTRECRRVRQQKTRATIQQPEQKPCAVCGDPIRSDNALGICQRNPECKAARWRKLQEEGPQGRFSYCEVCGRRLRRDNSMGICDGRDNPECARARDQRRGWRRGTSAVPEGWTPPAYIAAGAVYGRLTVLEDVQASTDPAICRCECDNKTTEIKRAVYLTCGKTQSCGCLRRELMSTHGGLTKHPLYRTWYGIVQRTTNPEESHYPNYGGRGIGVSERWLDLRTFIEDIEREIGPRPGGVSEAGWPLYSLDRIDVDGNYESGNVKWSTASEQLTNRRKVTTLTDQRDALAAQVEALKKRLKELGEEEPGTSQA